MWLAHTQMKKSRSRKRTATCLWYPSHTGRACMKLFVERIMSVTIDGDWELETHEKRLLVHLHSKHLTWCQGAEQNMTSHGLFK